MSKARADGPVLFFCGNEGDIEVFANFSGFLREAATALGAQLVFAEHRFYGQSLPFGPDFGRLQVQYLNVEQALEDYAQLIRCLGLWDGVASSAPVHFDRVGGSFFRMVTDAAEAVSPGCAQRVRRGFAAATSQTPGGRRDAASTVQRTESRQHLRAAFSLCNDDVRLDELILWARNAFVTVAMGNYPYATNLFGQGLKAWPLKSACEQKGLNALEFLAKAVGSYYNATGGVICHNITEEYRDCADQTGCGNLHSAWGRSWDVEACRQIVYYTSTNNVTDMFPAKEWGPRQLSQYCKQTWNITPETFWFGPWLSKIQQSSHIIFTYGLSDPWRGGGVLNSSRRSDLVSLKIREAGHIYDLAASHPDDLPDVRKVRPS
ncbi:unnamed protein product [Durusdinium trenchii]|uniref:Uncharacterized protein n=1 Tax=Durusdinium trenchii TaxID=1381693 RepID=A0ABP0S9P0_9DINO